MIVERYREELASEWDAFVRASRNGTFLLERGYMDYHRDRFADHSLLVRDDEGALLAVLPAHAESDRLRSHGGLSFGGLIVGPASKTPIYLQLFEALLTHLQTEFATFDYKSIPSIYHRQPAEEDRYAMFLLGAEVTRCDLLSVINRDDRLPYQSRRVRGIKKAASAGTTLHRETDFAPFWSLLTATLAERHEAAPVHSLTEIELLRRRFPENIVLHAARDPHDELLAGVVLYLSHRVAHTQYIAGSSKGREVHALDLLFDSLINEVSHDCTYFDFGGSHEAAGRAINTGLIEQKEGFGARSVTHDHYRIDLTRVRPGILTEALR